MNIAHYGQRQTEWKDDILGFSNTTIGGYGCLITCIGMVADQTPKEINDRLKNVNGYAAPANDPTQKNLVNWNKIVEAVPWVRFISRQRGAYDNAVAAKAIVDHGFYFGEVNAAPIGSPKGTHWVLMIGNGKIVDPWDGNEKPTSTYDFIGGAVLHAESKPVPVDPKIYTEKELQTKLKEREEHVKWELRQALEKYIKDTWG